jgi:hypothetical protein
MTRGSSAELQRKVQLVRSRTVVCPSCLRRVSTGVLLEQMSSGSSNQRWRLCSNSHLCGAHLTDADVALLLPKGWFHMHMQRHDLDQGDSCLARPAPNE